MWSLFGKKKGKTTLGPVVENFAFLECDMHSHMVAGIDDGAKNLDESVELIRGLYESGFRKMITTPHVHGDFYKNTSEKILENCTLLQQRLQQEGIPMKVKASAEYYLDRYFLTEVLPHGLLTFGNNQVLVEVSLMGWPKDFEDIMFTTQSKGYNLILAHPERYLYEDDVEVFHRLKEKGVQMQLNLLSLLGYYGKGVKEMAEVMLEEKLFDYVGTDMHHDRHLRNIKKYMGEHQEVMSRLYLYGGFKNKELWK